VSWNDAFAVTASGSTPVTVAVPDALVVAVTT
jgi:hypothetical protein